MFQDLTVKGFSRRKKKTVGQGALQMIFKASSAQPLNDPEQGGRVGGWWVGSRKQVATMYTSTALHTTNDHSFDIRMYSV